MNLQKGLGILMCVWTAIPGQGVQEIGREFINDPMPTPQCHASTLVETPEGLVAAWFGGSREGHADVGIWLSRQEQTRWLPAVEVANGVRSPTLRYPCWNPVLARLKNGEMLLFYKVGPDCSWWWGEVMRSVDHGKQWSKPERLPNGFWGPIKNKPIELADGRLLCGSSDEVGTWRMHVEWTCDGARSWARTGPLSGRTIHAIQPSFLLHPGGVLQALGRTQEKRLFSIFSRDQGHTWGEMQLLDVPNPNSGIDAVTLRDGRHLLVYNPVEKGRSPLSVALSNDGLAWTKATDLETEERGEFSYPAVIQTADGRVHITYTWKRQKVCHVVLTVE